MSDLDFPSIVAELVRCLRGKHSQTALSRRMNFRTNVLYNWEHQRRHPSATQLLLLAQQRGVDLRAAFESFFPSNPPTWLSQTTDFVTLDAVAQLTAATRGGTPLLHLARRAGVSRFALARWQSGIAEPRAWEWLSVLHHATHRIVDFLEHWTRGESLDALQEEYHRVHAARLVAEEHPLSQALLRCLELEDGGDAVALGRDAKKLGFDERHLSEVLELLETTRQVEFVDGRWVVLQTSPLNMRLQKEAAQRQRVFWAQYASERAPYAKSGLCAYNVCGVSAKGYDELRKLQREYMQKARALIETSHPVERVALLQVNLVALLDD
jgi:DNA-binding transcriptional regulator YiaG